MSLRQLEDSCNDINQKIFENGKAGLVWSGLKIQTDTAVAALIHHSARK
ncbi:MAG: hypothetical protein Q4G58_14790 [bacterium]|nr:hypothetical protein [bacterium]